MTDIKIFFDNTYDGSRSESEGKENSEDLTTLLKNADGKISRRGFLTVSGAAAVGVGLFSSGLLVSADAWANGALDKDASATLLLMARDLFPIDELEDIHYANIILPMGEKAAEDDALRQQLSEGAADLDQRATTHFGKKYIALENEDDRVVILKEIEGTAFFGSLRHAVMLGIYNNSELFPRLGYGGSSWEKGGYINRGFNDEIDWL